MVVPLQTQQPRLAGDTIERLPDQAQRLMCVFRWCVIFLWIFGSIIFFRQPLAALPVFVLAICGTVVLSDDRVMKPCYTLLTRVFLGQCSVSGVQMLPPVFTIAMLNSVLHGIEILKLCVLYWGRPSKKDDEDKFQPWAALLIGGVWACETVSTVVSLRIMNLVVAEAAAADALEGYQRLPGIAVPPRLPGLGAPLAPTGPASSAAAAAAQQGIVPFSGTGFKLGD